MKRKDGPRKHEMKLTGLASFSLVSYLSYIVQVHLPRNGTTQSGLSCPTTIGNQEAVHRYAMDKSVRGNPSIEFPLPRCVNSTTMISHYRSSM